MPFLPEFAGRPAYAARWIGAASEEEDKRTGSAAERRRGKKVGSLLDPGKVPIDGAAIRKTSTADAPQIAKARRMRLKQNAIRMQ